MLYEELVNEKFNDELIRELKIWSESLWEEVIERELEKISKLLHRTKVEEYLDVLFEGHGWSITDRP